MTHFNFKDTQSESEGIKKKKRFYGNRNQKKYG